MQPPPSPPPLWERLSTSRDPTAPTYQSGTVELEWLAELGPRLARSRKLFCNTSTNPGMVAKVKHWLSYAAVLHDAAADGVRPREPTAEESAVLSRFESAGRGTEWIEPLSGMGRHPFYHPRYFAKYCHFDRKLPKRSAFSTEYLIPADRCPTAHPGRRGLAGRGASHGAASHRSHSASSYGAASWRRPESRRILYDLGAGQFSGASGVDSEGRVADVTSAGASAVTSAGSASIAASIPFFVELYRRYGCCSSTVDPCPPLPPPPPTHLVALAPCFMSPPLTPSSIDRYSHMLYMSHVHVHMCRRCVAFDDIFAWEAASLDHRKWWADVPLSLRHRIRLYNTPVVEDAESLRRAHSVRTVNRTTGEEVWEGHGPAHSFLALLQATASKDE